MTAAASFGLTPEQFWGRPDDILSGMTLREFDFFVKGQQRRERANYKRLATLSFWLGAYFSKRPTKPEKLMGEKTETTSDVDDFVKQMNEKKNAEELVETILLDETVILDLGADVPLDDWFWTEDSEE